MPHPSRRTRRALLALGGLAASPALAGCLPRERINASCRWMDATAELPPPGDPARRAHLLEDVRVAQDLGIRFADSAAGRMSTPSWHDAESRCTEAVLGEIARRHGVPRAEVGALRGGRELWIDLLTVFLPVGAVVAVAGHREARRLVARSASRTRAPAAAGLAIRAPLAGALALSVAQCWGMSVEEWRSRSDHVSYRAFQLPASRHAWLVWGAATALFAAAAAVALLRRGGSPPAARPG